MFIPSSPVLLRCLERTITIKVCFFASICKKRIEARQQVKRRYSTNLHTSQMFGSTVRASHNFVHQLVPCVFLCREHLSLGGVSWWIRCFIINCILFLLLFFLTTPAIIITTMDKFNVTKPVEYLNVRT